LKLLLIVCGPPVRSVYCHCLSLHTNTNTNHIYIAPVCKAMMWVPNLKVKKLPECQFLTQKGQRSEGEPHSMSLD